MKKFIIFLTSCLIGGIGTVHSQTILRKANGYLTLESNGESYEVDKNIVTVKLDTNSAKIYRFNTLRINKLGFADIQVPIGEDIEKFISSLQDISDIKSITYNTYGQYHSNDPLYGQLWHLGRINAEQVWSNITMNADVIVGVLDSGLDYNHIDIGKGADGDERQNIHVNSQEIPNNNIDDDGNGYVDDCMGWNFETNTGDVKTSGYHGTFVAGVLAAKTNNNIGIAGVAGIRNNNKSVYILPLCTGTTRPVSSIIDDAIIYAVDNGAKIIQMSMSLAQNEAIDAAIEYAHQRGVLIVCSAGNNRGRDVRYPAKHQWVMAIGATNKENTRSSYSNYGQTLDCVAPGDSIYSTTLAGNYRYSSGTSFSSPQVSGVAALMFSANPLLNHTHVRSIINSSCTKLPTYTYENDTIHSDGTWNNETGYGMLNAQSAIAEAMNLLPAITITKILRSPGNEKYFTIKFKVNNADLLNQFKIEWGITNVTIGEIKDYKFNKLSDSEYQLTVYPTYIYITAFRIEGNIKKGSEKLYTVNAKVPNLTHTLYRLKSSIVNDVLEIEKTEDENNNGVNIRQSTPTDFFLNIYSSGSLVYTKEFSPTEKKITLNTNSFPKGYYVVTIQNENEILLSQTIIIRH